MCARSHTPVYLQQAEETCTLSGEVCCISTISSLSCVFSLYKQAIRNTSPRWWRTELGSSFLETDAVVWGVQPYAVACCLSEVADITLNTRRLPVADVFIVSGSLVFRLQSLFFISPFIHFKVVILMKLLHRHTASYHQHQASAFFRQAFSGKSSSTFLHRFNFTWDLNLTDVQRGSTNTRCQVCNKFSTLTAWERMDMSVKRKCSYSIKTHLLSIFTSYIWLGSDITTAVFHWRSRFIHLK